MRLVVSTCGTSVLTHGAPRETLELLNEVANRGHEELDADTLARIDRHVRERRARLMSAGIAEARSLSAELNGIIGLYGNTLSPEARADQHLLLATDTHLGRESADTVYEWLRSQGISVQDPRVINGLATDSIATFRLGVQELVDWCERTLPGYRAQHYRVVFNLTGGFKAVQGILNTLAHAYADEVVYIFQGSPNLLRIPSLPVTWDPVGIGRKHFPILRHLHLEGELPADEVASLPESLVLIEDGKAGLSLVGQIVWSKSWPQLYAEHLLDPPSARIRYTPRFIREVEGLDDPDLVVQVNEGVDQLDRLSRGDRTRALRSMKVDRVRGRHPTLPQVTHECYVTSEGAAYRIYFHHEDGGLVLDSLGTHL